jgi:hypothetical protein
MLLVLTEGRLCNWYSRGIYEFTVRRLGVGSSLLGAGQCLATDFCTREGHIQSAEGALQEGEALGLDSQWSRTEGAFQPRLEPTLIVRHIIVIVTRFQR